MSEKYFFWIKKLNLFKTLFYSLKYRGRVFVGKANIHCRGGAIHFADKHSTLFIGVNYSIPQNTVLDLFEGSQINICGNVFINRGAKIVLYTKANLSICDGLYLNENVKVYCSKNIEIGRKCAIAFDTFIADCDTHSILINGSVANHSKEIVIHDNVWIGAKCVVLKGSILNNNIIVGAQSLVRGELYSDFIYAGNPIKQISKFDTWIP